MHIYFWFTTVPFKFLVYGVINMQGLHIKQSQTRQYEWKFSLVRNTE